MQFTIPFTNRKIALGLLPETSQSRGFSRGSFQQDPTKALEGVKISANSFFVAWRNSADIFGCVREITETCGIGGHFFYNPSDDTKETPPDPAIEQQVMDLFKYQYSEGLQGFKEQAFEQYLITGNAYIEKIYAALGGSVLGLKVLDARTFQIVTDEFGNVYKYIQSSPFNDYKIREAMLFEPEEIIHWKKGTDHNSESFGFSPMETVLWEARADLSAMIANYFMFENNAVPAVQYILDSDLNEEQVKEAIELIKKQFKGPKNRGKSGALWGVKEIKQIQMTHQDMEYLAGRKFTTEKVCTAYGVPKSILGYSDGMTFNNVEGMMKKFYDGTVRKYETNFESMVNEEVIKGCLGLEDRIAFEFKEARFDTDEIIWRRAIDARIAGLVTTNGARRMVGEEPIDEAIHSEMGDTIYSGNGAAGALLTDIGVDPQADVDALDNLTKQVQSLNNNQPADVQDGS